MPASAPERVAMRFGVFEVNFESGELRKSGVKVKLQEQPFQLLALLLERPGEVVTREQLRQKLWPNGIYVDFERSLNRAVVKLRDALGDSAESPRFIETLPRRGYRFIAPVSDAIPATAEQPSVVPTNRKSPMRWSGFVGLAVALLLVVISIERLIKPSRSLQEQSIKAIAVLPLENLTGDAAQEYFADGMTDTLISDLSKIGALRVISRTSAMQYKGAHKTVPQIAKDLNVDAVIEGTVMRSGNKVRITAQLIEALTEQHLWGESYDRDLGDVLRLQSEVAQAIAQQIRVKLTPEQQARLGSARSVNPEAFEAYLKARYYWNTSFSTLEAIRNAQRSFEESIQKDANFAPAYVGLADCYSTLGVFRLVPPRDAYGPAKAALDKALKLDDTFAEAHAGLGLLSWRYEWNWPNAERELRYALELNPNYDDGHGWLALYLSWAGRRAEASAELAKIRNISPAYAFGPEPFFYYQLRDYESLLQFSRRFVQWNPGYWEGHYLVAVAYEGLGQPLQAIPEYQEAVRLSHGDSDPTAGLAHAYAMAGQRASAEKILRELLQKSKTSYISPYMIGTIYAGQDEKDKAFEFLEKAYQEQSPDIPYFLRADLRIDNLRSDPRFQDLLLRVGLP